MIFKPQAIRKAQQHLERVTKERSLYWSVCEKSQSAIRSLFADSDDVFHPLPPHTTFLPNSHAITAHYSFDFAQQVHYPSNPLQPGPIYFLTPRKCALFGVCCEGIPQQVNFLIDEAMDVGKGANTVASLLHYFFAHHGLGEEYVHLHADNCSGQNKNNIIIQVSCRGT